MITGTTLHLNKTSSAKDIMNYLRDGLAIGDYYQEKKQHFGKWGGTLAAVLGVGKDVNISEQKEAFINLLQGCHPATGQLIKAHKARAHGVAGYDLSSSPDKSVSIMAMFDPRIIEAHQRANAKAMAEMEKYASRRMRTGPQHNRTELPNKFTGNFLYCSFLHDLSRANEPHLHSHNFVLNMTMDEDGNYYSLDQKEMKRVIRYFSTIYTSEYAKDLQGMGYELEPVMYQGRIVSFRIKDVPMELCKKNSSRRQEILLEGEIYKQENKLDRALTEAERDILARETRAHKKLMTELEKKATVKSNFTSAEWSMLEGIAKEAKKAKVQTKEVNYEKAVNLAIEHLFERKSTVALRDILTEVMTQHFGELDYSDLHEYLSNEQNMEKHDLLDIELLRDCPVAEKYVTTERSLEREAYAVNVVNKGIEKCQPFNESFAPFDTKELLKYEEENHLNFDHQRLLINEILVSRDRYMNIQGKAGSGKSTMLKELIRGIQVNNDKIVALAPTNSAVDTLKDNGINAMTVAKFLYTCDKYDLTGSTILVDEAGLLSSRQGAQLLYVAEQTNSRIIFQGDTRQHSSVEAGDFVRGLEQYSKILTFGLNTINRQKDEEYRKAVELLSDCKTADGLKLLDKQGRIKERSDYIHSAVDAYQKEYFADPASCLYVATTNYEVDRLNEQIRTKVKSFGKNLLTHEEERTIFIRSSMTISRSKQAKSYNPGDYVFIQRDFPKFRRGQYLRIENIDTERNRLFLSNRRYLDLDMHYADITHGNQRQIGLAEGDKIICTYRDREHELFNGEALTIQKMHCKVDGEDYIKCVNSNGKVKFMPQDFQHYKHGYAVTSHRSQGMTVDNVVVVANNLNSESAYVALSRGRYGCQIHTPNKYDLINNAMDYVRPLAMDIIDHDRKRERLKQIDHTKELARLEKDFGKEQAQEVKKSLDKKPAKEMMQETFGFGKKIPKHEMSEQDLEISEIRQEIREINHKKRELEKTLNDIQEDLSLTETLEKNSEFDYDGSSNSELQERRERLIKLDEKYDSQIEVLLARHTAIEKQDIQPEYEQEPESKVEKQVEALEKEKKQLHWEMVKITTQLSWVETYKLPLKKYPGYQGVSPELIPTVEALEDRKEIVLSRLAEIKGQLGIDEEKSMKPAKETEKKEISEMSLDEIENAIEIKKEERANIQEKLEAIEMEPGKQQEELSARNVELVEELVDLALRKSELEPEQKKSAAWEPDKQERSIIHSRDLHKLDNLNGITKIIGDVDFSEYSFFNLGDVNEITGMAKFSDSEIDHLGSLEKVGSIDLRESYVDDTGKLETVRDTAYSDKEFDFDEWKDVEIGKKLIHFDMDMTEEYKEMRSPSKEPEKAISKERDRGIDIGF